MAKSNALSLEGLEVLSRIAAHLEESGKPVTARTLRKALALDADAFEAAAQHGRDLKVLLWQPQNYYKLLKPYVIPEEAYYDSVMESMERLWTKDGYEASHFYIENTSRRDSKIEGAWTRPDLTLVSHRKFSWTMGTEFDVVTFEIKRPDSANVLAVFEALSHAAAATRAYVVFPVKPDAWRKANPAQEQRVRDECVRHGVGLILIDTTQLPHQVHHVLKAARKEIDHEKCSNFLDAVVSSSGKKRISSWKS